MANALPKRRFHNTSVFGDGRRVPLDRNARARFVWLVRQDRRHGRLSATGEDVALALVAMIGGEGRLDPSHDTIRRRIGCALSTVQAAMNRLRDLGRIAWERRLRRDPSNGWRATQTSNAYVLLTEHHDTESWSGVRFRMKESGRQGEAQAARSFVPMVTDAERQAARSVLAARRSIVEARLLASRVAR